MTPSAKAVEKLAKELAKVAYPGPWLDIDEGHRRYYRGHARRFLRRYSPLTPAERKVVAAAKRWATSRYGPEYPERAERLRKAVDRLKGPKR